MTQSERRFEQFSEILTGYQQSHLLRHWPTLTEPQREELLGDLEQVDFETCAQLIEPYVRARPCVTLSADIQPAEILPAQPGIEHERQYRRARMVGEDVIRGGKVAAFTVAGGQGTRLGYDGPKGAFCISPVRNAPLFQLFAENLLGVRRRYGVAPLWFVMTSPTNHEQTTEFLARSDYFGYPRDNVRFFMQGQMPAFLPDGRMALRAPHRLALSPDGHGGSLRALVKAGALRDMRHEGVEYLSYFQVDNPLVKCIDPLFIGLHVLHESEMSSKAVTKANDLERVGNFCIVDGKLQVIEYSDLPNELALARNPDGTRRFDAGSIAIHVLNRAFIERLTDHGSAEQMPWHRAEKRMAVLADSDGPPRLEERQVIKLEAFIFDAIPLAHHALALYTPREEEFSPVKNADGNDSPFVARRDLIRRSARWLAQCGCEVPRTPDGDPIVPIEISPRFALDAADLRERLQEPPRIRPNEPVLLE